MLMQKYEKMMTSLMIVDVAASVGCSCPILVLLRWDVVMLGLALMVVVVEDDSTNHAKYLDAATVDLVEDHDDAVIDSNVVAALFLDEVVVDVPL